MKIFRSERRAFENSAEAVTSAAAAVEQVADTTRGLSSVASEDLAVLRSQVLRITRTVDKTGDAVQKASVEAADAANMAKHAVVVLVGIALGAYAVYVIPKILGR